ncbi:MAG TPA: nucleoside hydrolase [Gammaproteobacteria bacterium]|jgi:inosine-uridine nucleoside N-ribohydrolase|nr:nucleoside hydrolase [Gammaproteobacteria bacterium]MDP6733545.1 nucleoside hydrolase [Gammaproteobacteria bacterium]HAJ77186.1 nucleoside hydrolase [Gammaproteobacteria bacterium]|tara:strand:- start:40 stop:1035 length:996 start_codon:yes stop_codon:yes gene_type:complete
MNRLIFIVALCIQAANADPVKVIFDTDMGNDVDDALALAMLHSFENRAESELLAITISKDHVEVPPYIDAINTFYERGEIPLGITSSGITPQQSRFTGIIHEKTGESPVFPHDLLPGDPVQEATSLLRQTLSSQPDQSVVIIQVGFSTNLAGLLATSPDEHSELNGRDLVVRKVRFISIMAGTFAEISGETHLEYNVVQDIASAQILAREWPTKIIWSGFEVGLAIRYPAVSIENDFLYRERHPIRESYQLYIPTPHERPTWDLTSVVYAVRPDLEYFELSPPGIVSVLEDGETVFNPDQNGQHYFLRADDDRIPRIKEIMTLLVSEPPQP